MNIVFKALFKTTTAAEQFAKMIQNTYNSTTVGNLVTVSTINSVLNPTLTECDACNLVQIANTTRALECVQY